MATSRVAFETSIPTKECDIKVVSLPGLANAGSFCSTAKGERLQATVRFSLETGRSGDQCSATDSKGTKTQSNCRPSLCCPVYYPGSKTGQIEHTRRRGFAEVRRELDGSSIVEQSWW